MRRPGGRKHVARVFVKQIPDSLGPGRRGSGIAMSASSLPAKNTFVQIQGVGLVSLLFAIIANVI